MILKSLASLSSCLPTRVFTSLTQRRRVVRSLSLVLHAASVDDLNDLIDNDDELWIALMVRGLVGEEMRVYEEAQINNLAEILVRLDGSRSDGLKSLNFG